MIKESVDEQLYSDDFFKNDERIFYKNLVDMTNDEFVVLGDDGVSIKYVGDENMKDLEEKINKIANAHFSLNGRPSPSVDIINSIKRLVRQKKGLSRLSSQYDIDNI